MGTEYPYNKTIFHAFNMRYENIREKAKDIADAGFTHVQFPVVQESRGFKNYYELIKKEIDGKLYDSAMVSFIIRARLKEQKYKGNDFLTLHTQRKIYINQPILYELMTLYESQEFFDAAWGKYMASFDIQILRNIIIKLSDYILPGLVGFEVEHDMKKITSDDPIVREKIKKDKTSAATVRYEQRKQNLNQELPQFLNEFTLIEEKIRDIIVGEKGVSLYPLINHVNKFYQTLFTYNKNIFTYDFLKLGEYSISNEEQQFLLNFKNIESDFKKKIYNNKNYNEIEQKIKALNMKLEKENTKKVKIEIEKEILKLKRELEKVKQELIPVIEQEIQSNWLEKLLTYDEESRFIPLKTPKRTYKGFIEPFIEKYISQKYLNRPLAQIYEDESCSPTAKYVLTFYKYYLRNSNLTKDEKQTKENLSKILNYAIAIFDYIQKSEPSTNENDSTRFILTSEYELNRDYVEKIRNMFTKNPPKFSPSYKESELPSDLQDPIKFLYFIYVIEFVVNPPWWWAYQPAKFALGQTICGSKEELKNAIEACYCNHLKVIVDVVLNNLSADAGESPTWVRYLSTRLDEGKEPIVKSDTTVRYDELFLITKKLTGDNSVNRLPTLEDFNNYLPKEEQEQQCIKDVKHLLDKAFGYIPEYKELSNNEVLRLLTIPMSFMKDEQEPTYGWMHRALPQVNQSHPIIQKALDNFMKELVDIGVDGMRVDAARHIPYEYNKKYFELFDNYYKEKRNQREGSDCSYLEWSAEPTDKFGYNVYEREHKGDLRVEDFAVNKDLYNRIFVPGGDINRLKDVKGAELDRRPRNDSVVQILNHDAMMGSSKDSVIGVIPSSATYQLATAYLLQRINGIVLIMPHDLSFPYIRHALRLRKKMFDERINQEFTSINNDTEDSVGIPFISYKKKNDNDKFISIINTTGEVRKYTDRYKGKDITYESQPLSFAWLERISIDSINVKGAHVNWDKLKTQVLASGENNTGKRRLNEALSIERKLEDFHQYKNGLKVTYPSQRTYRTHQVYSPKYRFSDSVQSIKDIFYKPTPSDSAELDLVSDYNTTPNPIPEWASWNISTVKDRSAFEKINTTLFTEGGKRKQLRKWKTRKQKRSKRRITRKK